MSALVQTFTKCAVRIPDKETEGDRTKHTAWIVPASFGAKRYVNDARYRARERNAVEDRRL